MRLADKVAVVTGSGSGIGRGIARMFASQGARVLVTDWVTPGGEETVGLIEAAGGEARFIQGDVSVGGQVADVMRECIDAWDRIDILVNNASVLRLGSVTEMAETDWDMVIDINLKGVFLCSRHAIPHMIAGGGGAIVNIASVGGLVGPAQHAAYASAKAGVLNLTRQMAVEYGPDGVRVNSICPGTIPTPMHYSYYAPEDQEATLAEWAKLKPLRKVGTVEDIAYAALYLASEEAGFVTGANLIVDGGTMAGGR